MISRAVSRCCSEDVMASKTLIIGARAGVTRGGSHIVTPSRGMALQSSSRFGRQDSGLKCDGRRWHTKGLAPAATPVAAPVTAAQTAATVNTSAVFFTAGAYLAAWLLLRAVSFSNQRALKRTQEEASSPSSTVEVSQRMPLNLSHARTV